MTEQLRREIRAELARRMGWKLAHHGYGLSPDYPAVPQPRALPDPFTDAADNRALVEWLTADDARWHAFWLQLKAWMESQGNFPAYNPSGLVARWLLTLPREAITLAAARALGIQEAE